MEHCDGGAPGRADTGREDGVTQKLPNKLSPHLPESYLAADGKLPKCSRKLVVESARRPRPSWALHSDSSLPYVASSVTGGARPPPGQALERRALRMARWVQDRRCRKERRQAAGLSQSVGESPTRSSQGPLWRAASGEAGRCPSDALLRGSRLVPAASHPRQEKGERRRVRSPPVCVCVC